MKKLTRNGNSLVIVLVALSVASFLSMCLTSAPALAEGSGGPCPGENCPPDTNAVPDDSSPAGTGTSATVAIEQIVLILWALL